MYNYISIGKSVKGGLHRNQSACCTCMAMIIRPLQENSLLPIFYPHADFLPV